MHGPGLVNLDLNLSHDFRFSKVPDNAKILSVSINFFHVLNHVNDATYNGVITLHFSGVRWRLSRPGECNCTFQFKF